jgi:acetyl-CoA C-acetyltransferase
MSNSLLNKVAIIGAARTPIGKFGGALKDFSPAQLGTIVAREALSRSGLVPAEIGHVVFGNVIHTEARDMYLARVIALDAGLDVATSALTVNRLCGSGLQAIATAAQEIGLGNCSAALAGGAECMSRAPYWIPALRWGQRIGDATATDVMVGALTDPFDQCHMGVTAENIASSWNISRLEQDQLAAESHQRAVAAAQTGNFREQIVPLTLTRKDQTVTVDSDESPRSDSTIENLQKLKPAFQSNGSVTAGNASSINDGAAAVVLVDQEIAKLRGCPILGTFLDCVTVGVEPRYMGIGPVPAVRKLLERHHLVLQDIDLFEVNEAFAAQALAVIRDLDLPRAKTNIYGSGISLGHPIGATGAILVVKALYALRAIRGKLAIVTMCIGGGQGIAALLASGS